MLPQTNISDAYRYHTHSQFIQNMKPPIYNKTCIFCNCPNTQALTQDGFFRQCSQCRKQFRARVQ